jgi:ElaB/YqjD/DUF883 family membrane-anchored ribosome-binding protein
VADGFLALAALRSGRSTDGDEAMKSLPLAAALAAALTLAACDRAQEASVGQKLDRAVDKTERSLSQAGEKTRETLHENAPKVEQKLSVAGQKIEQATEKTVDRTKQAVSDASRDLHGSSKDHAAADTSAAH